jgi:hypothetical protein
MARADQLNSHPETAHFGATKFADLSADEFKYEYLSGLALDPSIPAPENWKVTSQSHSHMKIFDGFQ